MTRSLAFIAALLVTAVTVSSACIANSASDLRFELKPSARSGQVQLSLWSGTDRHHNMMGNSFQSNELSGTDVNALRSPGDRPISFSYRSRSGTDRLHRRSPQFRCARPLRLHAKREL